MTAVKDDFVSLHTHTHSSRFDGLGTEEQFCDRLCEMGQDAVAFTEHGTLSGLYNAHMATMKRSMKLVPGIEAYLAEDAELRGLTDDEKKSIKTRAGDAQEAKEALRAAQALRKERDHVTIWALNDKGLRNLYALSSWSWNQGYFCHPPGQEILTLKGVKPVEEVAVGDMVLTHLGRWRRVDAIQQRRHVGLLYGIELSNRYGRTTWLTGEHPVLVLGRGKSSPSWKLAKDIVGGRAVKTECIDSWAEFVCLSRFKGGSRTTVDVTSYVRSAGWIPREGGGYVKEVQRRGMGPTRHYSSSVQSLRLDYWTGYAIGLFCAEGSASPNQVNITLHRDETEMARAFDSFSRMFTSGRVGATRLNRKSKPGWKGADWFVCDSVLATFLRSACGKGSSSVRLPDFVMESGLDCLEGALDGVLDGDGSYSSDHTSLSVASETLAWQIRQIGSSLLGSFPSVRRIQRPSPAHSDSFHINLPPINRIRLAPHTKEDSNYVYRPISNVKQMEYDGPVYSFSVEEDDSYSSDFVLHNCKPRVDLKRLKQFSEGLAVSTGCPGGVVASPLKDGNLDIAIRRLEELKDTFGDRLYAEVMPHPPRECPDQAYRIARLAERYDIPLLATQDAHYPRKEDAHTHECLLCINTQDKMDNPADDGCTGGPRGRFVFDSHEYFLRSRAEMEAALRQMPRFRPEWVKPALDSTMLLAQRCTAKLYEDGISEALVKKGLLAPVGKYLSTPPLPPGVPSYDRWLQQLCREGIRTRFGCDFSGLPQNYKERLVFELNRMMELRFSSYFILVWDVRKWARGQDIEMGPGRGSAAGSLVCYLLEITDLDPVKWGLSFDRFLPESRKDLPDIDADYDMNRRDSVISYLQGKYGEDRVSLIGSANTFSGKAALRAAARIYSVPDWAIQPVTGLVVVAIEEEQQTDETLGDVLDHTEQGKAFKEKYPEVCRVARAIEGQQASAGVHAAGVVVSSAELASLVPLESRPRKGGVRFPCTAWDMRQIEQAGLVKIDVLGLKTLAQLYSTRKAIENLTGQAFRWDDEKAVPFDDPEMLSVFRQGVFVGIFQYDTPSSRRLCETFHFGGLASISLMTALNRPGPTKSGLADLYLDRANDPSLIPEAPASIAAIVAPTAGCIIYQEQVIEIAKHFSGYTPAEADGFRKKIGKKLGLSDEQEKFVKQAIERGESRAFAEALFADIKEFASYGFNMAHAYSYGALAAWTAWAKARYPGPFLAGCLANEGAVEKQLRLVLEARRLGIPVSSPEVNYSEASFVFAPSGEIVGSTGDIKGIGQAASDQIALLRPYESIEDFILKNAAHGRAVTSGTFRTLAQAGAFRALWRNQRQLVEAAQELWRHVKKPKKGRVATANDFFSSRPEVQDYSPDERTKAIAEVYPLYFPDEGSTLFELEEREVATALGRAVFAVGDDILENMESALVFGRLSSTKLFSDKTGRSARIALLGPNGEEMTVKVPVEACERYYSTALAKTGKHVVALLRFWQRRATLDGAWLSSEVRTGKSEEPVLNYMLSKTSSMPLDLAKASARVSEGTLFRVRGLLVSGQLFESSRGEWARFGVLGRYSYASVACFNKQFEAMPPHYVPGKPVEFLAEKTARGLVINSWGRGELDPSEEGR